MERTYYLNGEKTSLEDIYYTEDNTGINKIDIIKLGGLKND